MTESIDSFKFVESFELKILMLTEKWLWTSYILEFQKTFNVPIIDMIQIQLTKQ